MDGRNCGFSGYRRVGGLAGWPARQISPRQDHFNGQNSDVGEADSGRAYRFCSLLRNPKPWVESRQQFSSGDDQRASDDNVGAPALSSFTQGKANGGDMNLHKIWVFRIGLLLMLFIFRSEERCVGKVSCSWWWVDT